MKKIIFLLALPLASLFVMWRGEVLPAGRIFSDWFIVVLALGSIAIGSAWEIARPVSARHRGSSPVFFFGCMIFSLIFSFGYFTNRALLVKEKLNTGSYLLYSVNETEEEVAIFSWEDRSLWWGLNLFQRLVLVHKDNLLVETPIGMYLLNEDAPILVQNLGKFPEREWADGDFFQVITRAELARLGLVPFRTQNPGEFQVEVFFPPPK